MLYTGVTGKVSVKSGVAEAKTVCMATFNVDVSKSVIESARLGQPWKEKAIGVGEWSASLDGAADFGSTGNQKDLWDAFENGTELEYSFYLDATTFLVGDGLLESLSISQDAEGKAEISASVVGNGAVELTVPSAGT